LESFDDVTHQFDFLLARVFVGIDGHDKTFQRTCGSVDFNFFGHGFTFLL
jgi:hypothetical protein